MTEAEVQVLILRSKACFADMAYKATTFSMIGLTEKAEHHFRKARLLERYTDILVSIVTSNLDPRFFSNDFDTNFN